MTSAIVEANNSTDWTPSEYFDTFSTIYEVNTTPQSSGNTNSGLVVGIVMASICIVGLIFSTVVLYRTMSHRKYIKERAENAEP